MGSRYFQEVSSFGELLKHCLWNCEENSRIVMVDRMQTKNQNL